MKTKNKYLVFFSSTVIIAAIASAVMWENARQEVYFLCSNFTPGVEKFSVIKQLNTANLSSYNQSITESGSRIIFSSRLNFEVCQCIIELDKSNRVVRATFT